MNLTGKDLNEMFENFENSPDCADKSCQLCVLQKAIESIEFAPTLARFYAALAYYGPLTFTKILVANSVAVGIAKVEMGILEEMGK